MTEALIESLKQRTEGLRRREFRGQMRIEIPAHALYQVLSDVKAAGFDLLVLLQ